MHVLQRNIQGIGVGLSIVKKIVDQVDGEIKIESKTNVGTTLKILFKNYELSENDVIENNLEYTKPIKIVSFEKLEEERYEKGKYNILIVEDNIHLLAYLQNSIKSKYNVYYAWNGEEALRKLEYIPKPNIIISDILMDIMDGYDFYNVLSDNERYKDIPVIFLTAKTSLDEKVEGLSKGAVDYIYKPFHINELLAKINSIIRSQEVTREINITEMENKIAKVLRTEIDYDENNAFNDKCDKYDMSSKERKIIKFLINGFEYKEISFKLNSSTNTIKKRIHNIYKKIRNVFDRTLSREEIKCNCEDFSYWSLVFCL